MTDMLHFRPYYLGDPPPGETWGSLIDDDSRKLVYIRLTKNDLRHVGKIKLLRAEALKTKLPANEATFELAQAIAQGEFIRPIRVGKSTDGTYYVKDGRHRLLAYRLNGFVNVPVVVVENQAHIWLMRVKPKTTAEFTYMTIDQIPESCQDSLQRWLYGQTVCQVQEQGISISPDGRQTPFRRDATAIYWDDFTRWRDAYIAGYTAKVID